MLLQHRQGVKGVIFHISAN